jgi:hypothetical protein
MTLLTTDLCMDGVSKMLMITFGKLLIWMKRSLGKCKENSPYQYFAGLWFRYLLQKA